jgi:hypothetical protein
MTTKSITMLIIPAASGFFVSEMQFVYGVKDRVQYREGFLLKLLVVKNSPCMMVVHIRIEK